MNKTEIKAKIKGLEAQYERERSDLRNWWISNKDHRWYFNAGGGRRRSNAYKQKANTTLPNLVYQRKAIKFWKERLNAKR